MAFEFLFKRKQLDNISPEFFQKIDEDMLAIEGGDLLMGSNEGEDDERPIHNVLIDSFSICKYEVTQGQWYKLMGTKPWEGLKYVEDGAQYPAVNIDWYAARDFVRRMSKLTNLPYRLPHEAEWEYACRAESTSRFFHGSLKLNLQQYAWFYDNAFKKGDMHAMEVGSRKPNKWGLYDTLGNVYEWVSDWYSRNYYNKSPVQNPKGPRYGSYKVVRGGDWARTDYFLRVTSRRYYSPHYKDVNVGFRVARDVENENENKLDR